MRWPLTARLDIEQKSPEELQVLRDPHEKNPSDAI